MKRKNQTGKKFGKLVAAAMAAAFVFMSASNVSAEEKVTEVEPSSIVDVVDVLDGEGESEPIGTPVMMEDGTIMYYSNIHDLDTGRTRTVYDWAFPDNTLAADTLYRINWTCNPDTRHVSGDYKMTKGQYISAAVIVTPDGKKFKLGVMDDEGNSWHVDGVDGAAFNFKIPRTDMYRVYVQNDYRSTTLYATGNFEYYTK